MKRIAYDKLVEWKNSSDRKPLIIEGARQVGKTWLMQEFGKNEYDDVAYFYFYKNQTLKEIFNENYDVDRIKALINGVVFSEEDEIDG